MPKFQPKKPVFVSVRYADGTTAKLARKRKPKEKIIAVLVVDQEGKLLQSMEWSVDRISKQLDIAKKKGVSTTRIAADLVGIGNEADQAVYEEVMAALRQK